eukprot:6214364-Pleurochrysis_carterae.AAC.3
MNTGATGLASQSARAHETTPQPWAHTAKRHTLAGGSQESAPPAHHSTSEGGGRAAAGRSVWPRWVSSGGRTKRRVSAALARAVVLQRAMRMVIVTAARRLRLYDCVLMVRSGVVRHGVAQARVREGGAREAQGRREGSAREARWEARWEAQAAQRAAQRAAAREGERR